MKKREEFRYNKRRGHYSYIYDEDGDNRKNLLLSTKPTRKTKSGGKEYSAKNIKLDKHPNPNSNKDVWVMTRRFVDNKKAFSKNAYKNWKFTKSDKMKIDKIINKK